MTAILKYMANKTCTDIVTVVKHMPFSTTANGSTDQNVVKLYPISFVDRENNQPKQNFN